jgi:hypothetical protein
MATIESSTLPDALLLELTSTNEPQHECDCTGILQNHGTSIACTTHDSCTHNKVSRVCFSCLRRFCSNCFNDLHQNPSLFGCLTLSHVTYCDLHRLFRTCGLPNKDKNSQLTMTLDSINIHYKQFITKQKSSKHCRRTLRDLKGQFGGAYTISLLEFCRAYTKGNALSFSHVETEPLQAFQALNGCGRCFYRCSKKGFFASTSFLCFSRMLARIKSEQGENVHTILSMMYHLLIINFIGLIFYVGLLLIPWLLTTTLRDQATQVTDWVGLLSGHGLDALPISFGGFPTSTFSDQNSSQHFAILLPIYIFCIFAMATIYSFHLLSRNRQVFSETLNSPALTGQVAATAFSMFKYNSTESAAQTKKAHADYETNLRMAMVKKYNVGEANRTCWEKVKARGLFPMIVSFILIMASAGGLFCLDYFGIAARYNVQGRLGQYAKHYQLLMPGVFFLVKFFVERITIALVKHEVPKKIHLYNHFRAVLYYRLNFLNVCYLAVLITLSMFSEAEPEPFHYSVSIAQQIANGWCADAQSCACKPSKTGFFWYSYLVMWVYFELFTFILSILRSLVQRCVGSKSYFSPIPRIAQMWFLQCLVWCSIFHLPASVIVGFIATFLSFFLSYFKAQVLKSRPETGVYLLPSKIEFYTAFIFLLVASYVPSAILFSQTPNCGAFVNPRDVFDNVFGIFSQETTQFPVVLNQIFHYLTSPVVIWLLIICCCSAIVALSRLTRVSKSTRNKLINQLKIESYQRAQLIKQLGANFKQEDARGDALFVQWMMKVNDNPGVSRASGYSHADIRQYLLKVQRKHPNLLELIRLSSEQLQAVFLHCGCPLQIAEMLTESLQQLRNEVVLKTQRVL